AHRYRVADIAVWRRGDIGKTIPTVPPFLAIEILSPDDRMSRMQPKVKEYLSIGAEWVWVIDPEERKAIVYSAADPLGTLTGTLTTENPRIELPLEEILNPPA
ncbi:MAG: Uma2 family endonuclease, partial [Pseudomonadota bacterium]